RFSTRNVARAGGNRKKTNASKNCSSTPTATTRHGTRVLFSLNPQASNRMTAMPRTPRIPRLDNIFGGSAQLPLIAPHGHRDRRSRRAGAQTHSHDSVRKNRQSRSPVPRSEKNFFLM